MVRRDTSEQFDFIFELPGKSMRNYIFINI